MVMMDRSLDRSFVRVGNLIQRNDDGVRMKRGNKRRFEARLESNRIDPVGSNSQKIKRGIDR